MPTDVRDKPQLGHDDVLRLNFINPNVRYHFRRHYRVGLRSHIMEVLKPEDFDYETNGVLKKGLKWFPKATPIRMLRIFRTRFNSLKDAEDELKRVKILVSYLAPDHIAHSDEFLVDYAMDDHREFILCGLQKYVEGEILDPWAELDRDHLLMLYRRMGTNAEENDLQSTPWIERIEKAVESFALKLRQLVLEAKHIPDLAGVGNLLLTRTGNVKLVDINNISEVLFDPVIHVDDRGYPVCDKSIQALSILERKILQNPPSKEDPLYQTYLHPNRMRDVKVLVDEFHRKSKSISQAYGPSG